MSNNKLSDGWHRIGGYCVYCENGLVVRPYDGGSLYYWDSKYGIPYNLLPCEPSLIRYYARVGKLRLI